MVVCARPAGATALCGLNNPIGELHAGVVLLRARAAALQHPEHALDAGAARNRQVRASTHTLRASTRQVAQRAQRHARVLLSGHQ